MNRQGDRGMVCAVVCAGGVETTYRRAGCGPAVIVLGFNFGDVDAGPPAPLAPLIACCRVIVPDHASITALAPSSGPACEPFSGWLRGFIEGLGLEGARVVAAAGLDVALRQFLATHPGAIERLLIVGTGPGACSQAPTPDPGAAAVWRATARVTWSEIARFVAAEWPTSESSAPG